jgi:7,8-dihydro-6-hydroxymethylpterin-pyrophosphokinase
MLRAAELWAFARNRGFQTADPKRLDIDVILAAQALTLEVPTAEIVVATSNVGHLSHFVSALVWSEIAP